MLQDIRYAIRGFLRAPGFVVTVILTIGLALGLNTALFTIFDAYVLRPFAVRDPYSLYSMSWAAKGGRRPLSFREFEQLRAEDSVFSGAIATEIVLTTVDGRPLIGQRVSADYFTMLGVDAAMGRPLVPEDAIGPQPVMVLSHGAWKAKFGSDPAILGKSFTMLGGSYTLVGIARPAFEGVSPAPPDFWIPLADDHPIAQLSVVIRLKQGVSLREARAALAVLAARFTADGPAERRAIGVQLTLNSSSMSLNTGTVMIFAPTLAAFGLVLVIACANVANMMLARAMARQKEIGVRLALGAGRGRIIRQLLVESILLGAPAGVAGYAIARAAIGAAQQLYFSSVPAFLGNLVRILPLEPDARVFAFVFIAALAATLGFGLAPAIQAARHDIAQAARGEFGGMRSSGLRNALVISQITVCALLLICAGILLRGSAALEHRDPGLAARNVMNVELQNTPATAIVERLRLEPMIENAAVASRGPLSGFRTIPVAPAPGASLVRAGYNLVSSGYFDLLRIPILRGRVFSIDEADSEAPLVVISEATAAAFWPHRNPLGELIRMEPDPRVDRGRLPAFHTAQVVGVVGDVTSGGIAGGPDPTMLYFPSNTRGAESRALLVRVKSDTQAVRRSLNEIVERLAPGSVRLAYSLDEFVSLQMFPFRLSYKIGGFLGGLALVLTIAGIYGVLSYLIVQRTREIGVRIALGASARDVIRLVLSQSSRLATAGIAIGTLLALGVSRIFASLLEEINTYEPIAYGAAIAAVFAAALAASYFPSRRATKIDPASTLRYD